MSERHIDTEDERRLTDAGFSSRRTSVGKRLWKDPKTGQEMLGGDALDEVERREERELEEAGWERTEVEGHTYWCKPDSGYLYPRGAAYDVHNRGGGTE